MAVEAEPSVARNRLSGSMQLYLAACVIFLLCAALTIYFFRSMTGGMPMPGGWKMSMAWMHMGSWPLMLGMFCLMWLAMMVVMMLPSSLPVLMLVRRSLQLRGARHSELLTWTVAAGYFLAWSCFGLLAFAAGVGCAQAAMASDAFSRAVPWLTGAAVIVAGVYQLLPMKMGCLRSCRDPLLLVANMGDGWRAALRLGLRHGMFCVSCCWALMLIQLVLGVMSLPVMVVIALVIAWEKLSGSPTLPARVAGVTAVLAGLAIVARSLLSL